MAKEKVSVIVPVYNTEKYIPQCLESLISQTLKEIEIICVNDGSTDGSFAILQEFAQKDSRIKIINQDDQGPGIAKNNGMKIASGKYFAFADPDDYIERDALETLFSFAEKLNSQIIQFNYKEFEESTGKEEIVSFGKKALREYGFNLKATSHYAWRDLKENIFCHLDPHTWSYFYNAEFVRKNDIHFATGRRAEDHLFSFGAALCAEKIDYLDKCLYNYRRWNGSKTKTRGDDNFSVFDNVEQLKDFIEKKGLWQELCGEFHRYEKEIMVWHYSQTPPNRIKEYKAICAGKLTRKEYKEVMKKAKGKDGVKNFLKMTAKKILPARMQMFLKSVLKKK